MYYRPSVRMVGAVVDDDKARGYVNDALPVVVGATVNVLKGPGAGAAANLATRALTKKAPKATAVVGASFAIATVQSIASMALIVAGPPILLGYGVKKLFDL